jgi:ABC-type transporter Mla subunit MlaD
MTDARRPVHVGVFLGLSAGAYALCLAVVTSLQAQSEAAVMRDRGPTVAAIAALAAHNDALEADARHAGRTYERAAGAYGAVGQSLADVDAELAQLARLVGQIDGAAQSLPDRVALPQVSGTIRNVSRPAVHATTGASGG